MERPLYYLSILEGLKAVARTRGYALGLHGSLARDLDLIAVPWIPSASSAKELVAALIQHTGGCLKAEHASDPFYQDGQPGLKPHGRLCWSIQLGQGRYIDLSVMPRRNEGDVPNAWTGTAGTTATVQVDPPLILDAMIGDVKKIEPTPVEVEFLEGFRRMTEEQRQKIADAIREAYRNGELPGPLFFAP